MKLTDKAKLLLTDAHAFYKKFKNEKWIVVYKYAVVLGLITGLLGQLRTIQAIDNPFLAALGITFGLFMGAVVGPFINAAIPHIGVMIYGKHDYWKTFRAIIYGRLVGIVYVIPAMFFMYFAVNPEGGILNIIFMIPFGVLIFAAVVHSVYTQLVGLKEHHHLSYGKGLVCIFVIPILIILAFVAAVAAIMLLFGVGAMVLPPIA